MGVATPVDVDRSLRHDTQGRQTADLEECRGYRYRESTFNVINLSLIGAQRRRDELQLE